jgi:hypothetical protein
LEDPEEVSFKLRSDKDEYALSLRFLGQATDVIKLIKGSRKVDVKT